MIAAAKVKEKARPANPLDSTMTPAQVARRKFKSSLPRKVENRRLSAEAALGEMFILFDRFRGMIADAGQDPDKTLHAALAFCLPESNPAMLGDVLLLPDLPGLGNFCNAVGALSRPLFLGVVFVQLDPNTDNPNYKWASFCTQFMGGPEAESRLLYAQKKLLADIENRAKNLMKR